MRAVAPLSALTLISVIEPSSNIFVQRSITSAVEPIVSTNLLILASVMTPLAPDEILDD